MRNWILAIVLLPLVAAGAETAETKPAAASESKLPEVLKVPEGAKRLDASTWRHTDEKGKTWIYRLTPFGVVRLEEKGDSDSSAEPESEAASSVPLFAYDEGDQVRFERQSPFGKHTWRKKKSELNEEERRAWDKSRGTSAASKETKQE